MQNYSSPRPVGISKLKSPVFIDGRTIVEFIPFPSVCVM